MVNLWRLNFERAGGELRHHLTAGMVIRINTKLLHKVIPLHTP